MPPLPNCSPSVQRNPTNRALSNTSDSLSLAESVSPRPLLTILAQIRNVVNPPAGSTDHRNTLCSLSAGVSKSWAGWGRVAFFSHGQGPVRANR